MAIGLDLVLLPIDAVSGRARFGPGVAFAVAVGELVDLALVGRAGLTGERLVVRDHAPVGELVVDKALVRLATWAGELPSVSQWVAGRGPWRIDEYLAELERVEVLRLVPVEAGGGGGKRIEVRDGRRVRGAVERLKRAIADGERSAYEDQAFAALAEAGGCARGHLRGWRHRADLKRLRELGVAACREGRDGDTGDEATARAILREGIRALRRQAKSAGGSSRTIDEQIGLTGIVRSSGTAGSGDFPSMIHSAGGGDLRCPRYLCKSLDINVRTSPAALPA